jgi:hypothetical protein
MVEWIVWWQVSTTQFTRYLKLNLVYICAVGESTVISVIFTLALSCCVGISCYSSHYELSWRGGAQHKILQEEVRWKGPVPPPPTHLQQHTNTTKSCTVRNQTMGFMWQFRQFYKKKEIPRLRKKNVKKKRKMCSFNGDGNSSQNEYCIRTKVCCP